MADLALGLRDSRGLTILSIKGFEIRRKETSQKLVGLVHLRPSMIMMFSLSLLSPDAQLIHSFRILVHLQHLRPFRNAIPLLMIFSIEASY
jgi:hypothetical protein